MPPAFDPGDIQVCVEAYVLLSQFAFQPGRSQPGNNLPNKKVISPLLFHSPNYRNNALIFYYTLVAYKEVSPASGLNRGLPANFNPFTPQSCRFRTLRICQKPAFPAALHPKTTGAAAGTFHRKLQIITTPNSRKHNIRKAADYARPKLSAASVTTSTDSLSEHSILQKIAE
ncbi:hypothetical protein [Alistipes sp.]|uniref:hypothetical protein n=1 Tax=Alistipes sp. TaxID=1872444 RepID=UPI0025BA191B|nr:hypothetical protein [Alistipes sp.]